RAREDDTVVTRAYTGKTCRVIANRYTELYERGELQPEPFPMQVVRTIQEGVNHLGGDEDTPGADLERELFPARQGVGAIRALARPRADAGAPATRAAPCRSGGGRRRRSRQASATHSLSLLTRAGTSSAIGVTLSDVTPTSLKAAMRSRT